MRLIKMMLPALLVAGLATPAWGAPAPGGPPPSVWTFNGSQLVWTAPGPVPMGDAAIEFWDGGRLLGRPHPSADLRTFSLAAAKVSGLGELQVRAAGRRLDAQEQLRPTTSTPLPAPPPQPAGAVDPGTPGPFQTRTGEYALDPIRLPGYAQPVEMQAVVVAPKGAPGKRPLALFLHGRHFTCYNPANADEVSADWPCKANDKPIPSYRGYLQAQRLRADQGPGKVAVLPDPGGTYSAAAVGRGGVSGLLSLQALGGNGAVGRLMSLPVQNRHRSSRAGHGPSLHGGLRQGRRPCQARDGARGAGLPHRPAGSPHLGE
jgi:hypothetical protein